MADDFENHCWKDIVPPDVLDIYTHYHRKTFVGPSPAFFMSPMLQKIPFCSQRFSLANGCSTQHGRDIE